MSASMPALGATPNMADNPSSILHTHSVSPVDHAATMSAVVASASASALEPTLEPTLGPTLGPTLEDASRFTTYTAASEKDKQAITLKRDMRAIKSPYLGMVRTAEATSTYPFEHAPPVKDLRGPSLVGDTKALLKDIRSTRSLERKWLSTSSNVYDRLHSTALQKTDISDHVASCLNGPSSTSHGPGRRLRTRHLAKKSRSSKFHLAQHRATSDYVAMRLARIAQQAVRTAAAEVVRYESTVVVNKALSMKVRLMKEREIHKRRMKEESKERHIEAQRSRNRTAAVVQLKRATLDREAKEQRLSRVTTTRRLPLSPNVYPVIKKRQLKELEEKNGPPSKEDDDDPASGDIAPFDPNMSPLISSNPPKGEPKTKPKATAESDTKTAGEAKSNSSTQPQTSAQAGGLTSTAKKLQPPGSKRSGKSTRPKRTVGLPPEVLENMWDPLPDYPSLAGDTKVNRGVEGKPLFPEPEEYPLPEVGEYQITREDGLEELRMSTVDIGDRATVDKAPTDTHDGAFAPLIPEYLDGRPGVESSLSGSGIWYMNPEGAQGEWDSISVVKKEIRPKPKSVVSPSGRVQAHKGPGGRPDPAACTVKPREHIAEAEESLITVEAYGGHPTELYEAGPDDVRLHTMPLPKFAAAPAIGHPDIGLVPPPEPPQIVVTGRPVGTPIDKHRPPMEPAVQRHFEVETLAQRATRLATPTASRPGSRVRPRGPPSRGEPLPAHDIQTQPSYEDTTDTRGNVEVGARFVVDDGFTPRDTSPVPDFTIEDVRVGDSVSPLARDRNNAHGGPHSSAAVSRKLSRQGSRSVSFGDRPDSRGTDMSAGGRPDSRESRARRESRGRLESGEARGARGSPNPRGKSKGDLPRTRSKASMAHGGSNLSLPPVHPFDERSDTSSVFSYVEPDASTPNSSARSDVSGISDLPNAEGKDKPSAEGKDKEEDERVPTPPPTPPQRRQELSESLLATRDGDRLPRVPQSSALSARALPGRGSPPQSRKGTASRDRGPARPGSREAIPPTHQADFGGSGDVESWGEHREEYFMSRPLSPPSVDTSKRGPGRVPSPSERLTKLPQRYQDEVPYRFAADTGARHTAPLRDKTMFIKPGQIGKRVLLAPLMPKFHNTALLPRSRTSVGPAGGPAGRPYRDRAAIQATEHIIRRPGSAELEALRSTMSLIGGGTHAASIMPEDSWGEALDAGLSFEDSMGDFPTRDLASRGSATRANAGYTTILGVERESIPPPPSSPPQKGHLHTSSMADSVAGWPGYDQPRSHPSNHGDDLMATISRGRDNASFDHGTWTISSPGDVPIRQSTPGFGQGES